MRVCFLLTGLSGYMSASLEALARRPGVEVFMLTPDLPPDVAFDREHVTPAGVTTSVYPDIPPGPALLETVAPLAPDVVLASGWQVEAYRHVARRLRPRPLRVAYMDSQWRRTGKQVLGVLAARAYLHPYFDALFLPGDRQATFAEKLGYPNARIWRGLYTCDHDRFTEAYDARLASIASPDAFLFVGRLVAEKGIHTLAEAYARYRARSQRPWPLLVAGMGPLEHVLATSDGVQMLGFVQPGSLPDLLGRAGCLVLPSLVEPWGVVIHEATAAGAPIICSTACGSVPHLVEDGFNGLLVEPGSAHELAAAMERFAGLPAERRRQMSVQGRHLSFRYTPETWADTVVARATEALTGRAQVGPR